MTGMIDVQIREETELSLDGLMTERLALERRLVEGYYRIEEALEQGQDVSNWERFWIELLHQYEMICQSMERLAA